MDPLSMSLTFATIVGLLGDYASENRDEKTKNLEDFLFWLHENHHEEICNLIKSNAQASNEIKELLQEGQTTVINKLNKLDRLLASVAIHLDNFRGIAIALKPDSIISDQAIHILKELDKSGGSGLHEIKYLGGSMLTVTDGGQINLNITEPRFLEDDFNTLCELGFLRLEYMSKNRLFRYTRQGAAFVAALPKT